MAFIYLPTVRVQPYKVFGVTLFAVESAGSCLDTDDVWLIQHAWFDHQSFANRYADKFRQGGEA